MPTTLRLSSLLLALPLTSLVACQWNEVETGKNGLVEMTPSECGKPGCDLDDGVAVGGTLLVKLTGTDGHDARDLSLVSSAPWIVDVIGQEGGTFDPEFRIAGNAAGRADLIAIDSWGYEVDYVPIEVAAISDLAIDANADELNVIGVDVAYQAAAGSELRLDAVGLSRGRELTGDVQYLTELDAPIAQAMLDGADPSRGHLRFTVPTGDHDVRFTAPGGASKTIRIIGR
jgi:hypothetical protein